MSAPEIIESLKKLILEVHQKQKELSQVILEKSKGLLSPSMVQLTDPKMLLEEKQIISLVETGLSDTSLKFQDTFKELMERCEMKNKMITNLLYDLKNNFSLQGVAKWETTESTSCPSEPDSFKDAETSEGFQTDHEKPVKPSAVKKTKRIKIKNPPIGICPDCKKKIKPRKICKKCGEVENPDGKHYLKCIDCGNEVVQTKTCPKCNSLERAKNESKGSFATLAVPQFSDKDLKFLREPSESFLSATVDEFSSYESLSAQVMKDMLPEYEDPSEESFLTIKMQDDDKTDDDRKSLEALGSSFAKLSEEIEEVLTKVKEQKKSPQEIQEVPAEVKAQKKSPEEIKEILTEVKPQKKSPEEIKENLPEVKARSEESGDHPVDNIKNLEKSPSPKKPLPAPSPPQSDGVNEDFDVEVYSEPDSDDDDDSADYRSIGEMPEEIREQIKNVTEYDKLPQIPKTESDYDLFHDIIEEEPEPEPIDNDEIFEEFEEIFPYQPGLNIISLPSSASFQKVLRLLVATDNPKKSYVITPLHSLGRLTLIERNQTASSVNLSLNRNQSRACILLFVQQSFKMPFVEIFEVPKKIIKPPKKFASLVVARAQTLNSFRAISLLETSPSTRIEIKNPETEIEIKKLVSPTQAAVFETEKALIFAGIEFKEKFPTVAIENTNNEDEDFDAFADAEDRPFPNELFGSLPGVPTTVRESDEEMYFESAVDFVRKIKPKAKAQVENTQTIPVTDESEERLDKLLRLLSQLEKAIKESEMEEKSSTAVGLVKEIGKSVEALGKISSDISRVERIFESDSVEILETDSDRKLRMDMKEELIDTKRSIYEELEGESSEMEKRIEKDFDRIDRLIRENDEAVKFVEAFVEKTMRRASEFEEIKQQIANLQRELEILIENLEESRNNVKTNENLEVNTADVQSTTTDVGNDAIQLTTVKDTISILMDDLDKLKNKAKEKNERCKEIFGERFVLPEQAKPLTGLEKTKSSFTMKKTATSILEFKNVGFNSFYLSWSKPEDPTADAILGYEILVNGKINQKVRNPDRLHTVLYTVDSEEKTEVQLYGLTKIGLMLLGEVTYLN